jgi:hypothetical protein
MLIRCVLLLAVTLTLSACDRPAEGTLGRLLPSTVRPVAVITTGFPFAATASVCPFDLIVGASRTVTLDHVTVELIDGTNLGGPMIPVPPPRTTGHSGPAVIIGGTTRTFGFQPFFPCSHLVGNVVSVRAFFVDDDGVTHLADTKTRF